MLLQICTIVFYLMTLYALYCEYHHFIDAKVYSSAIKEDENIKKIIKGEDSPLKTLLKNEFYRSLVYMVWSIIGLGTFQWYAFVVIILMSVLMRKKKVWVLRLDAIVSTLVLLFILYNKMFLHLHLHF